MLAEYLFYFKKGITKPSLAVRKKSGKLKIYSFRYIALRKNKLIPSTSISVDFKITFDKRHFFLDPKTIERVLEENSSPGTRNSLEPH